MKTKIFRSEERGHANHGWLKTYHSFSFASWYNPERMHFGKLRVMNDDEIAGGTGFGTHPHENMEIITIPIEGALEHKDSMGNHGVISAGEVQIMSAGTGIEHSEYNHNKDQSGKFLQLWIFPEKDDVEPRYDQKKFDINDMQNRFLQLVGPGPADEGLWIYQQAYISITNLNQGRKVSYTMKNHKNGVFLFLIEGSVEINHQDLKRRDAIEITETDKIEISAKQESRILLIEVPLH
ncbi:MAG: hypothetical protein C0592_12305 [Marinilabiliales bacterium]|nr:MAG: hypothetical protein C0592_12305 [Marinilabiliales bacterium]